MAVAKTSKIKWLLVALGVWGVAMTCILIYTQSQIGGADLFDLRFNPFALLSLLSALANLSFALYIHKNRQDYKSDEITWYLLFVYTLTFFGVFEMMQRLSATPQAAIYWASLSGIAPGFIGVGLFLFTLQFTRPNTRLNNTIPILLLSGALLFFFFGSSNAIFINTVEATKSYPWGFNNEIGKAFVLDFTWALGLASVSLILMARFKRNTKNPTLKKQATIFMIAIAIPIFGALFFDSLFPLLGVKAPPMAGIATVATAGLMLYGLTHYKLFRITPASMSGEVLSTMSESVIVTDSKLQIHLMNEAANSLFGKYKKEDLNQSLIDFFTEDQAKRLAEGINNITGVGNKYSMGTFVFDQITFLKITAIKISEEHGVNGYIFAITDVTELQKSYDALQKEKDSVELKVEERTKELRQAEERLAETDKIKTEFVVLTSHNLRTPLTTIKGNLEFLGESKLTKDQKQYLSVLETSTKRLSDLVEELLTISQIEAGDKVKLETVKLADVLGPVVDEAENLATASHNKFSYENEAKDLELNANVARLRTAIHNLLENAFKFTQKGHVKLSVTSENGITIKVIDDGIGITADEIPKLFTKFHRGSDEDTFKFDYSGEGIGLYLTRLIIEEHQGKINVTSEPQKGTTFTINLPKVA